MEHNSIMKALFIIVNAGFAEEVIEVARGTGVKGATIINARGAGAHPELIMGITVDAEKEIILCIANEDVCRKTMSAIKEKAGIKTPSHSICFTMPVEDALGLSLHAQQDDN